MTDIYELDSASTLTDRQIISTLTRRFQQLIILPTEKCNFRCTYCYEDFKIGQMSSEIQSSLEMLMSLRIPELDEMSINWFGGEPLAAQSVVLRLSAHANRLCDDHGVILSGGLTTNAYRLHFDLFEELVSYRQNFFQITLDGFGEVHDAVRKLANGKGSFQKIWDNLAQTKRSEKQFRVLIRIHVRRDNIDSLELLMAELGKTFGGDPRYELDFEHLRNLGGEGGLTVTSPVSLSEMPAIEARLRQVFRNHSPFGATVGIPQALPSMNQLAEKKNVVGLAEPYICYAAKANSLLIRADGRIGKCTVALDDDRNTIGRVNTDGTIAIDNQRLMPWVRGIASRSVIELQCPLVGLP